MSNIIGQEALVKDLHKIFNIFVASKCNIRPHFILTGASGSGKTYTIKSLCAEMNLKFLDINAAQLTKEGTAGNSLSKALSPIINIGNVPTVIFVDEFDKLFITGNSNAQIAQESTTAVQNEFLKVLESETASVYNDFGKYATVPMKQTLFIFAGAFNNEPNVTLDRLRDFGVKTEFLGRVGLIYNTKRLSIDDLYTILEKSPILNNYLKLFKETNKVDVISTIKEYLNKTYDNNTLGARSVNTLIHQYFIKGGKLGNCEAEEVTFQTQLKLN